MSALLQNEILEHADIHGVDPKLLESALALSTRAGRILAIAALDFAASLDCSREEVQALALRARLIRLAADIGDKADLQEQTDRLMLGLKETERLIQDNRPGSGSRTGFTAEQVNGLPKAYDAGLRRVVDSEPEQ